MIIVNNSLDQKDEKKRHIVLTLLLFLFVVGDMIALKNVTSDILVFDLNFAFAALSVVDLVCSYFLFMWKKWAFWGILICSLITFILNLSTGTSLLFSLMGLLGIVLLFGALQLKRQGKSGWKNLE